MHILLNIRKHCESHFPKTDSTVQCCSSVHLVLLCTYSVAVFCQTQGLDRVLLAYTGGRPVCCGNGPPTEISMYY